MKLNNRGFSLTELIVASGIGVVLAGIAGFSFIEAMNMFTRTTRQYTAEADMIGAMYNLKSNLVHATQIEYGGDASTASNAKTSRGAIANDGGTGLLFSYPASTGSGIYLIAYGARELNSTTATANVASNLYAFGIYYQRYETTTSGALYFDLEKNNVNAGSADETAGQWAKVSPRNAAQAYGRFTEFATENIRVANTDGSITMSAAAASDIGKRVLGADFRLSMRYHTRGFVKNWKWCPKALIAGTAACISDTNYYDIEKKLKVVFVNNEITNTNGYSNRPYGRLYFFHSAPPASRR